MLVLFTSSSSHIHGLLIDTKVNDVNGVMAVISRANYIKLVKVDLHIHCEAKNLHHLIFAIILSNLFIWQ